MKLEAIITLANRKMRVYFLAMERSLRSVGCDLPLLVIPFDEDQFDLPVNASWWLPTDLKDWLVTVNGSGYLRKYACLLRANYHYVDVDVCFLKDPQSVLSDHSGFVTCCPEWRDTWHTVTSDTKPLFMAKSTTWQLHTFASGQFACDEQLYDLETLKRTASTAPLATVCLGPVLDQPAMNALVLMSGVKITNLTLPPYCLESPFVTDYPGDPAAYWQDEQKKPYMLHFPGNALATPRPLNDVFYSYLTAEERAELAEQVSLRARAEQKYARSLRRRLGATRRAVVNLLRAVWS